MLIIKNSQIESFIAEDDTQLVRVIREIIQEAFHEGVETYSEKKLDGMVRMGIEKARSRGFERAEDIASFVSIMFEISPEFDMNEQIDAFLKDESYPPEMKLEQLLGRTQDDVWRAAEGTYDAKSWFRDPHPED
ncbi:MAG: hypothetical protein DWQ47_08910 [Acidobacteria bacterium]|nr:MAG: hypothetical protein DWQ32_17010 [Acidobacteriota bacterium]REJ98976.1 MAG: hypothetical protein DWQ38_12970 [Acidobacteriota bacterium]REK16304.1 MAG: hypothetical protein DWQ43_04720 [Acidobacteriota bacterium]REK43985.1 MAG: hypothetical protein DWQ47_08910 [Acidobacteriota bacterium]